jgi:hypothetical protein
MKWVFVAALCFALLVPFAFADDAKPTATIEVPVIDLPDMSNGRLRAPTMPQSLDLSSAFHETAAVALQHAFGEHQRRGKWAVSIFDLITLSEVPLPFSDIWLHEEFHRAVLSSRGIGSRNDVYDLNVGADAISVSHVRDEDLIRLKRDHPADQVRLQEAGIEGELMLTRRLEKDHFFGHSNAWHLPVYWLVKIGTWGYLASGATNDADVDTDNMNRKEGADVARRDFTGHDFNGWVYDLFRPDEPYTARGTHPSGVGINRYRKSTDLTPEERAFLHRQGRWSLINFLDPNLVDFDGADLRVAGRTLTVNANAAHFLTSFGYTIDANVFLRDDARHKLFITLHDYVNGERNFPGVEVEWLDHAVIVRGRQFTVTPRVGVWLQPANQRFRDTDASAGGLASLRVATPVRGRFGSFVELETKSAGWVAGNVHLDPATAVRFGLTARLW